MQIAWILALAFAFLVALFAVQNTTTVSVSFLFWSVSNVALPLVVIIAAAVGALIATLASIPSVVRGRLRQRALKKGAQQYQQRIAELEAELERQRSEYEERIRELEAELQRQQIPPPALPAETSSPRAE